MKKILFTVVCFIFLSGMGTGIASAIAADKPISDASADVKDMETYRLLALFGDVFDKVRQDYVEDVTDKKLVESALNGMLSSLDPHSGYLNEESFKDMQVQTKGEFGGLGIEVTMDSGWVKVVSPIDDTPAYKAGIKTGDYITHIDSTAVLGLSLNEAVDKMRGKAGTEILLTVRREGVAEPLKFTLVRDIIKINPVRFEARKDENIGYIRINSFSEKTLAKTNEALSSIHKDLKGKEIGYILDLRNNPGGLLDQAIDIADLFLESGEIVSTRSRNPEDTARFSATEGDVTDGLPLVVLINAGSASASEIVAGALQDHRRAIVVGTKSFGKGSVQSVIPVSNHGAIRITTARYYTPSGVSIQAEGIIPDIEIHQSKVEELDKVEGISESNLPKALTNDSTKAEMNKKIKDKSANDKKATKKNDKGKDKDDALPKVSDYQLDRAIDILKGIAVYRSSDKVIMQEQAKSSDKDEMKGKDKDQSKDKDKKNGK